MAELTIADSILAVAWRPAAVSAAAGFSLAAVNQVRIVLVLFVAQVRAAEGGREN